MKCPKCQAENPKEAKFCSQCACRLELVCPQCSRPNPAESRFCTECGHELAASTMAPGAGHTQLQSYTPKALADKILASRQSMEGER